jgi:catechol 2,3-dioxygenase-like lactoylglutathione lyase family enzyme
MAAAAEAHSLLHVNLNSRDVAASAGFYERVLGLTVGMQTSGDATSGAALGAYGEVTTLAMFLYDDRGPRAAPALELLEWRSPEPLGQSPDEPSHAGIAAVGFRVPSLADVRAKAPTQTVDLGAWPWRAASARLLRLRDPDGIRVELVEDPTLRSPQFSHLRLNVHELAASIAWYARIGLQAGASAVSAPVDGAVVSVCSLSAAGDPSLSFELTAWEHPPVTGGPIRPANHVGIYRMALAVDDVGAACRELRDDWPEVPDPLWVELPGTRLGGVNVLFLRDPDGTTVELVERPRAAMKKRPVDQVKAQ